jgi:hypothetical protein
MKYFALLVKADTWEILKDRVIFIHAEKGPFVELKKEDVVTISPTVFPPIDSTKQAFEEFCRNLNRRQIEQG